MPLSFFESLAIADQERIHSQMIAWMLTPAVDGAPLNAQQRRQLLSDAFGFSVAVPVCDELVVMTEVSSIDIVVFAGADLLVVENKLKSRQSPGQLLRYDAAVNVLDIMSRRRTS